MGKSAMMALPLKRVCTKFTLFLLIFSKSIVSQDISWVNEFVRKPTSDWDGSTYLIPVIEGETELIQCRVRAENILTLKYSQDFHANTTNTTSVGTPPDEYSVVNITL